MVGIAGPCGWADGFAPFAAKEPVRMYTLRGNSLGGGRRRDTLVGRDFWDGSEGTNKRFVSSRTAAGSAAVARTAMAQRAGGLG